MLEKRILPNIGNALISIFFGVAMILMLIYQLAIVLNNSATIQQMQKDQYEMRIQQQNNIREIEENKETIQKIQSNSNIDAYNLARQRFGKGPQRKV